MWYNIYVTENSASRPQKSGRKEKIMTANVKVPVIKHVSNYCYKCNGKHWVEGDNAKTQANVKATFGIIPNDCVNGNDNAIKCPFALGLLR